MRKYSHLIISAIFAVTLFACGPTTEQAIDYNDAIIAEQKLVLNKENQLINIIANNQQDQINSMHKELLDQIDNSIRTVNELKGHSKFNGFRDATLALFKVYKEVVEGEYAEVIKIAQLPDEEYTKEADDKIMEVSGQIDSKLEKALNDFGDAQEKFAEELDFQLKEEPSM